MGKGRAKVRPPFAEVVVAVNGRNPGSLCPGFEEFCRLGGGQGAGKHLLGALEFEIVDEVDEQQGERASSPWVVSVQERNAIPHAAAQAQRGEACARRGNQEWTT